MQNVISMGEELGPHQEPHLGRRLVCTVLGDKCPFLPILSFFLYKPGALAICITQEREPKVPAQIPALPEASWLISGQAFHLSVKNFGWE